MAIRVQIFPDEVITVESNVMVAFGVTKHGDLYRVEGWCRDDLEFILLNRFNTLQEAEEAMSKLAEQVEGDDTAYSQS